MDMTKRLAAYRRQNGHPHYSARQGRRVRKKVRRDGPLLRTAYAESAVCDDGGEAA